MDIISPKYSFSLFTRLLVDITLYAGSILVKTTEEICMAIGVRPIAQVPNVNGFSESKNVGGWPANIFVVVSYQSRDLQYGQYLVR